MKKTTTVLALIAPAFFFTGCEKAKQPEESPPAKTDKAPAQPDSPAIKPSAEAAPHSHPVFVDPGAKDGAMVTKAIAVMHPTKDNKAAGVVRFQKAGHALKVTAEMTGLPKGKHAYHIHLLGDCSGDDGKTAGTHFNLAGSSKKPPADIKRITGNLGHLVAEKNGDANSETLLENASLGGPFSILGRAVIVHEKPNDPKSPPIGAAGGRVACGVIGITE